MAYTSAFASGQVTGKVVIEFGVYSMEATEIRRLGLKADPRLGEEAQAQLKQSGE